MLAWKKRRGANPTPKKFNDVGFIPIAIYWAQKLVD
jgi:hypothetical protein